MKSPRTGIALLIVAWLALVGWVSIEKSHHDSHAKPAAKGTKPHDPKTCECCREGHTHEGHGDDHHGHDH